MKHLSRYTLIAVVGFVTVIAAAALGTLSTQASAAAQTTSSKSAPVTVVNTPLPVSLDGSITGAVSISGTPNVVVTNLVRRVPYHFALSGSSLDGNWVGSDGRDSHTIPALSTLSINHVSCEANSSFESDHPLEVSLRIPSGMGGSYGLVAMTINALQHGTRRHWSGTTQAQAYLGRAEGPIAVNNTVELFGTIRDGDSDIFLQCYVAGELFQYGN